MIYKVYEKVKELIKENYKFLITLTFLTIICSIRLPFYINAPGGIININDRVKIQNEYKKEGSFNLTYVSEIKATIPTIIMSYINKDWKLLKQEEVIYENETIEDEYFRNHLMLKEANNIAIKYAYQKALKEVKIISSKIYVTYIDPSADTDLKIGDQIIEINNHMINNKEDIYNLLSNYLIDDIIKFKVISNNQEIEKTGKLKKINGKQAVGILITSDEEISVMPPIKLSFNNSESGPSGGFMVTLSIYNSLIENDLTHGYKIAGTGTIDEDGNVGTIGGIEYKIKGAVKSKADIFLVPSGENYEDAIKLKKKNKYNIDIIEIKTFDEALKYLNNID